MIENILDFNLKCKLISLTFNKSSLSWKLLNGVRGYWDQCLIHSFSTSPELKTLEWINFNPDFLIRISTVETFHFSP